MPSYLVGHGGGLSPGTPGGNPVGNAISTAIAVDSQRLRQQESATHQRMAGIQEQAQRMKDLRAQIDLVGTKSPQGQALLHEASSAMGIQTDPHSTDPELLGTVIQNGFKGVDKILGDKTLSPEAKQEKIFELHQAASSALLAGGGTKAERAQGAQTLQTDATSALRSAEGFAKTEQHGVQVGQSLGGTLAAQDHSHQLRREFRQEFPPAGRAGSDRSGIDASSGLRSEIKALENGTYKAQDGSEIGWNQLDPAARTALVADARTRAQAAAGAGGPLPPVPGVPGQDPSAVGPSVGPAGGAGAQPVTRTTLKPIGLPKAGTGKIADVMAAADASVAQFSQINPNATAADLDAKLDAEFEAAGYFGEDGQVLPDMKDVYTKILAKYGVLPQ